MATFEGNALSCGMDLLMLSISRTEAMDGSQGMLRAN